MTIFVGGIHAVGKTYMLRTACGNLGVRHASSSQLIKEHRGRQTWTDAKQVDDIADNQRALVAAVARIENEGQTLVLDGHFVLRRGVDQHEGIDPLTFEQLRVHGVLLLEASPAVVDQRLKDRGDTSWKLAEVEAFALREREHARLVCETLGVNLIVLHMPDVLVVEDVISRLARGTPGCARATLDLSDH